MKRGEVEWRDEEGRSRGRDEEGRGRGRDEEVWDGGRDEEGRGRGWGDLRYSREGDEYEGKVGVLPHSPLFLHVVTIYR